MKCVRYCTEMQTMKRKMQRSKENLKLSMKIHNAECLSDEAVEVVCILCL